MPLASVFLLDGFSEAFRTHDAPGFGLAFGDSKN